MAVMVNFSRWFSKLRLGPATRQVANDLADPLMVEAGTPPGPANSATPSFTASASG